MLLAMALAWMWKKFVITRVFPAMQLVASYDRKLGMQHYDGCLEKEAGVAFIDTSAICWKLVSSLGRSGLILSKACNAQPHAAQGACKIS